MQSRFAYVASDNPRFAKTVVEAIEMFAVVLSAHPDIGRPTSASGARVCPVPRLPDLIFFRRRPEELQILNVRHRKRRRLA